MKIMICAGDVNPETDEQADEVSEALHELASRVRSDGLAWLYHGGNFGLLTVRGE